MNMLMAHTCGAVWSPVRKTLQRITAILIAHSNRHRAGQMTLQKHLF